MINKKCQCGIVFLVRNYRAKTAKYCSNKCRQNGHKGFKPWNKDKKLPQSSGENAHQWKGEDASYGAKHKWLYKTFGKAGKCENFTSQFLEFPCKNTSKRFEWALLDGKKYERKIENFKELCHSCHKKYDFRKNICHVCHKSFNSII